MKKFSTIVGVTIVLSFLTSTGLSAAQTDPCDGVNPIKILNAKGESTKLKNILLHYNDSEYLLTNYQIPSPIYNKTGTKEEYYLCFQIAPAFAPLAEQLVFEIKDDRDVFISGLDIKSNVSLLLKIQNPENHKSVVHFVNSTLTGSTTDTCLEIAASNTIVDGATVTKCSTGISVAANGIAIKNSVISNSSVGVKVEAGGSNASIDGSKVTSSSEGISVAADNVKITNSEISGNGIGVQITSGILHTKTESNRIYGNVEEIKIADGPPNEIYFYKGDTTNFVPVIDLDENTVIEYKDTPAYLNVMLNGASVSNDMVTIEFFISESSSTFSHPQASELLPVKAISVPASQLARESIKVQVPADYRERTLTAILDDPRYGTTGFSHKFVAATGDIVAFVTSPFDMQSQGGNNMDSGDVLSDGTDTSGVVVESGGGSGGDMGSGMGMKKACTLIPGGTARTVDVAMALWWIILAAGFIGTLRMAAVRIRKK